MTMPTIADTLAFIRLAHVGQVDKAGRPYHEHPTRVLAILNWLFPDAPDSARHAALLHDVLEDTLVTATDLLARGYDEETVEIVQLVTRDLHDGLTYHERIGKLAAGSSVWARAVKLADNVDNSVRARLALVRSDERDRLARRYARARHMLGTALIADGLLKEIPKP